MNLLTKSLILLSLFISFSTHAQLRVSALFSDNMILQQQTEARIWGWDNPKTPILIDASWMDKVIKIKTDKVGKWDTFIPTPAAGGPYEITISSKEEIKIENVMIGEVWLCTGQSNMEMPMRGFMGEPVLNSNKEILRSENSNIRWITVPRKSTTIPQEDFEGNWQSASPATTGNLSATAYYFARLVQETTGIPVGLVDVTYGGSIVQAWMSESMLQQYESVEIPANDGEIGHQSRTPTTLFYGMMNPVVGFTIKGAIWYQGESNAHEPLFYEEIFPDMVHHWRAIWDQGVFPFYFVQIAPYDYDRYHKSKGRPLVWYANSAYLRDAQRKSQYTIPKSGMVSILDGGSMKTIHPMDKKKPGERLAYMALAETYGYEGFGYATPDYDELNIEDSLITVTFKNLPNGLTSYNKEVTAFEIAGADKVYYPAKCKVRRKSVQVWSDKVENPVAVRYAFTNEGPAQLFSTEGLPISSFRTDDWNPEDISISK